MSSLVWVEIDREAPDRNLRELRTAAGGRALMCAVVKGNAYGHGVREIVPLLPSADWFAVNSLEEAVELRSLGVTRPVLILGHVPLCRLGEALEGGFRLTVYNPETVAALESAASASRPARIHVKVETGTGRQGIPPTGALALVRRAREIPGVEVEGLSTHFANIEDTLNHSYAEMQLETFGRVLEALGPERPPVVHTACTAACILFRETVFDMVRTGIGLYGLWPSRETYLSAVSGGGRVPDLRPVLSWKTRIVQVKDMPEGSYIGYGCTYRTTRRSLIGVLPVGYSDGLDRGLGNTAFVLVRGRRAPIVGRVCMNLTMIDLTDIPDPALEEEVTLLGGSGSETVSAETMASWAGTINYEIVTRISPLLPRAVVDAGRGPGTEAGACS